ncbi:glycosyltransferase [Candidatus Pelagibacter ubique]|nr:glycosyltransferase [Candidatus Pelagibacter ubique]
MSDLVTIIIPYYKKKKFFKKTIKSVLRQTHKNFKIFLIYDDVDKSELPFVKFTLRKIKNVKIIFNKKNLGAGYSRNIGIKKSNSRLIAFLDSDDTWHKDKLKKQIKFMKMKKVDFSFTDYSIIDKNEKKIKIIKAPKIITYQNLLFSCDIGLSTVMINARLLKKEKFPNLKTKEDYLLWIKLSKKKIKMLGINETLASWRQTNNSLSSSIIQKLKDAFLVYNYHLKFNFLKSLILVFLLSINSLTKKYL